MYVCRDNVSALLFSVKLKSLLEATWNMRFTYSSLSSLSTYTFFWLQKSQFSLESSPLNVNQIYKYKIRN